MQDLATMQQQMSRPSAQPSSQAEPRANTSMEPTQQSQPSQFEATLNALPEDQKAAVAEHLTPEIATIIGVVMGDMSIPEQLMPFVDSSRILVPMPREEFLANLAQQQGQAPAGAPNNAAAAAPTASPQGGVSSTQQQTATPAPQGAGPV